MKIVCAWCERILEDGPPPVSHGMCTSCYARQMNEVRKMRERPNIGVEEVGGIKRHT